MFTMMDMATDPGPGRAPDHLLEDFWEMTLIQQAEDEVRRAAQKTAEVGAGAGPRAGSHREEGRDVCTASSVRLTNWPWTV